MFCYREPLELLFKLQRIFIFSSTMGNRLLYKVQESLMKDGCLYLYHICEGRDYNHFDVSTYMKGFL